MDVRGQGGTLDLHTDTGLKALRAAGVYDEFTKRCRYDGEAVVLVDKTMRKYIYLGGTNERSSRGRPEIDRGDLRKILYNSLPKETIRWNCRLRSIDPQTLSLHFDHGSETGFDLIVGADGAWSKVRPLLSSDRPFYAGIGGFDFLIKDAKMQHPPQYRLVNGGSFFAYSDGKNLGAQQLGDGSIIVRAYGQKGEDWQKECDYDIHNGNEVKEAVKKEYGDWAKPFMELIDAADEKDIIARCLYALPTGNRWTHRPHATLIGDAAHLTTPFAGEGVNVAMEDALNLANAIIKSSKADGDSLQSLDANIKAFEEEMFARAAPVQWLSMENMKLMFFVPGAPYTTVHEWVRNAVSTSWVVRTFVPLWFVRLGLRLYFWW